MTMKERIQIAAEAIRFADHAAELMDHQAVGPADAEWARSYALASIAKSLAVLADVTVADEAKP